MPSRLLIVDDHEIVRMGVRTLFAHNDLFDVCGEAQSGTEAIRLVPELSPDLVILDLSMPGINGFETAAKIRLLAPSIRIVLFSIHDIPSSVRWVDVDAFVSKSSSLEELLLTVNRLLQLGRYLSPESDFYPGPTRGHDSSVPGEIRERRRQPRIDLSPALRIRA